MLRDAFRLLGQALSLALWRRPRSRPVWAGFGGFLAGATLALLLFMWQDHHDTEPPTQFYIDALYLHGSFFLATLVAAWLGARTLRREALWLPLATLLVLVGIPWMALSVQVPVWLAQADELQLGAWQVLLALGGLVAMVRTVGFLSAATPAPRRWLTAMLCALVLAWPWHLRTTAWFWYPPDDGTSADAAPSDDDAPDDDPGDDEDEDDTANGTRSADAAPAFDPEAVMAAQPGLLQAATQSLAPQRPGHVDLYAVGFAGDGSEPVFRNEVDYFGDLMASRFGAEGRTLRLVNYPGTVEHTPLATLTNLRQALAAVARRMDTDEDVLLLFLTSHGSQDHRLAVDLDPLPLDQIEPEDLRQALDDAGIRWRVVVVSACYSGGFVDALDDPDTLVITAARADRTSFGCGNDSQITWFGKAFLADALNRTRDFPEAFALASRQVREWELAEGETPSVPQLREGAQIGAKLGQWAQQLPPAAPPVPFRPAAANAP